MNNQNLKPGDVVWRVYKGELEGARVYKVTKSYVWLTGLDHRNWWTGLAFNCRNWFHLRVKFHTTKSDALLNERDQIVGQLDDLENELRSIYRLLSEQQGVK